MSELQDKEKGRMVWVRPLGPRQMRGPAVLLASSSLRVDRQPGRGLARLGPSSWWSGWAAMRARGAFWCPIHQFLFLGARHPQQVSSTEKANPGGVRANG